MKLPKIDNGPTLLLAAGLSFAVYRWLNPGDPDPEDGPAGDVTAAGEDMRPATFTRAEAMGIASNIAAGLYGIGGEDEATVVRDLKKCLVTADVRLVVNAYGERALVLGWFVVRNLQQAVALYLAPSDIEAINADYRAKGIKYSF